MTKEEKQRDTYYRRKYGITLDYYNKLGEDQGWVCASCGNPPKNNRLAVDHDHKFKYLKIDYEEVRHGWIGSVSLPNGMNIHIQKPKRNAITKQLRTLLKQASVRGLLCFSCNAGLRKFRDNPDYLEGAAKYLRRFKFGNGNNSNVIDGTS